jgi:long-chain acyl-CoA synthetase
MNCQNILGRSDVASSVSSSSDDASEKSNVRSFPARLGLVELLSDLPDRFSHIIRRSAQERPTHPALIDDVAVWTYRELAALVADVTGALRARGIRAGDRVIIIGENSVPLAAFLLAASEIDAWSVIINPRLSDREVDQIRDHSGARRIFYIGDSTAPAKKHADRHGAAAVQMGALGSLWIGPVNEAAIPEPVEAHGSRQVAAVLYTSGTTGAPKGVMLTHRNLLYAAKAYCHRCGISQDDRIYGVLPMSHIMGLSFNLIGCLLVGATLRIASRFDPAALLSSIAEERISALFGVPAMYQLLLKFKTASAVIAPAQGQARLRRLMVAGAPLRLSLKNRIEAEWGVPLLNAYGLTETSPSIAAVGLEAPAGDESVGPPVVGTEVKIVDCQGHPVTPGQVGELHVRGPGVMRGYYKAPDLTAAVIDRDGWFKTGDLARLENGNLYIAGRADELIIRSGFNVYPAEIEAVLDAHPDVARSAVVGRTADGNEEIVAFVQLLPRTLADPAALAAYARDRLAAHKRPSEIVILEALPLEASGKIRKRELAAAAARNLSGAPWGGSSGPETP